MRTLGRILALFLAGTLAGTMAAAQTRGSAQAQSRQAAERPVRSTGSLADRLRKILAEPELSHIQIGISVTTLNGNAVFSLNDGQLFPPASTAKLATTAAAFGLLPVSTLTWTTFVTADGEVDSSGTLHGNLLLLGVGDPTLDGRRYPYQEPGSNPAQPAPKAMDVLDLIAEQVEQSGVRKIEGNVVGDDSYFLYEPFGKGWGWDDIQWSYGAEVSALSFNDNGIGLSFTGTPGAATTTAAWTPDVDYYTLDNSMAVAAEGAQAQPGIERPPGTLMVRAWGTAPAEGMQVSLAVEDPAQFTAAAFAKAIEARGIRVTGSAVSAHRLAVGTGDFAAERAQKVELHPSDLSTVVAPVQERRVLAAHISGPVAQAITVANKASLNLHAELLLRLLGKVEASDGSFEQGSRVVRQFLVDAGVNDGDFFLYDGSGMSPDDRIAPRAYTKLLGYASHQSWGEAWRNTLPVAGVDGTLESRFRDTPLKGKMWAKTGTLNEVNALAGYLTAATGRTLAFAMMIDGRRPGSDAEARAIDRIVEAIAAAE
jgi:D-alanyl-D-alanine carboxypeptidase/D-alanyl-D-alanine-endopeptidase (penicillin-binding protein 4)